MAKKSSAYKGPQQVGESGSEAGLYRAPSGLLHTAGSLVGDDTKGIYVRRFGPPLPETETGPVTQDKSFGVIPNIHEKFFTRRQRTQAKQSD